MDRPLQYPDPAIVPVHHFDGTREHATPADRLAAVRAAARELREELLDGPVAPMFRSFDLTKVPYPTRFGLREATWIPAPYIHILNRLFVVQFQTDEGVKTLLAEPLDRFANAETPFFKNLAAPLGGARARLPNMIWPELGRVETILERLGIRPEDVDYITYDHLHTQDLRKWLGSHDREPFFPNAKLLVTRQEWASAHGLLPLDAQWYCPNGIDGVSEDRVIFLDSDVVIGGCVGLIRTPGHTEGNHSIVVHTPDGLYVTSENGVAADSYAPEHSRIPGVREYARRTGAEVILNGNTLESSLHQYISMVAEKEIAGPSPRNPDFPNVAPSSEMSPHPLSPGLVPTHRVGELSYGAALTRDGAGAQSAA